MRVVMPRCEAGVMVERRAKNITGRFGRNRPTGVYPSDWPEIARRVKDRAGWRCERCGHPHETATSRRPCDEACKHLADGKQRMLTTAHLDNDRANCAWWNLAALCQVCHLQLQTRLVMAQGWMFDHSDWMRDRVAAMEEGRQEAP